MSLEPWLTPLPDADQMRFTDRWAIDDCGIPSLDLMERAGQGLAALGDEIAPNGPVAVICGPGNNGGDGYVAARIWRDHGRDVRVLAVGTPGSDDAAANAARLPGDPPEPFDAARLDGCALIVDALLGTGSKGAPREEYAHAIDAVNSAAADVVAADVPSGVDASTGEVVTNAIQATATATFAAAKPGLWIHPGKRHAGQVKVIDIGIPRGAPVEPSTGLIEAGVLDLIPRRGAESTKFTSGQLLVAGGSRGLTGAPCLTSLAAMRAGAGYVTACVPESLDPIFEAKLTEAMTVGLADRDGSFVAGAAAAVIERSGRAGALVLGPGLGAEAADFATEVAARAPIALVLDADGLNAHAGKLEQLSVRGAPTILTPHAGELARLLGTSAEEVSARRLTHAREAAAIANATVVLKGDDTIIATNGLRPGFHSRVGGSREYPGSNGLRPGFHSRAEGSRECPASNGLTAINQGDSPGLATAGTGDVLSGIIGALLAAGLEPFVAACAAVWIHTVAGNRAAVAHGSPNGVIASDVIDQIPVAAIQASGPRR